jgi:hypothetical protein
MTCRHAIGDPSCSSTVKTPDAANYIIEQVERIGPHLILKVKYPNCSSCAYEGTKVLVYLNITEIQVLRWRRIDPHFADPAVKLRPEDAPSPAARFPASVTGWIDALTYARGKVSSPTQTI